MNDCSNKYLILSPYRSGLGNVIMSYECGLAISYITGRSIVLSPTQHITHITHGPKETHPRLWDIFDEKINKEEFEFVDYFTHNDFVANRQSIETDRCWFDNFNKVFEDCYKWKSHSFYHTTPADLCFVNNANQYTNNSDFDNFVCQRQLIDLDRSEKYILFDDTLFQHFWYLIYPGGPAERNRLKNKINRCVRYKQEYYDKFNDSIMAKIGPYNAVHVRRNDFFIQFGSTIESVSTGEKLVSQLKRVFDTDRPLYIATDESDLEFFNPVRHEFKHVYFNSNVVADNDLLTKAIMDQIICSKATDFYGIQNSTFSKRINVMRGVDGLTAHDNMGINNLDNPGLEKGPWPWHYTHSRQWSWNMSSYLQWTEEHVPQC